MNDPTRRMSQLMKRVRGNRVPTSDTIVQETFIRLGLQPGTSTPKQILQDFNQYLHLLFRETLNTLEAYEEQAYTTGIPEEFMKEFAGDFDVAEREAAQAGFRRGFTRLFGDLYPWFRRAFLSISQSRMTRGGKDFELQIEGLLRLGNVPFEKQEKRTHTDLMLPDAETFQKNRNISMVISAKRTLRERWAEVAEELFNLRSPNVFLFTADEKVTEGHIDQICHQYNIHLVVWDNVKSNFPHEPLVLSYTEWATERLNQLRAWW